MTEDKKLLLRLAAHMPEVRVDFSHDKHKIAFERKGLGWNPLTWEEDFDYVIRKHEIHNKLPDYEKMNRRDVLLAIVNNPEKYVFS